MGLFDFLFPPNASSNHNSLKRIADQQEWKSLKNDHRATRLEDRIDELENDVMTLTLSLASLLDTINEKGLITRDEVKEKMRQLDGLDGLKDGKLSVSVLRNWTNSTDT